MNDIIKDEEIVPNYSLDGIYEQIILFTEINPFLFKKIQNARFLEQVKKYLN